MSSSPQAGSSVPVDSCGVITRTRGMLGRLVLLAVVVLLLGQILVAWFAVTGFEKALEPQLNHKARAVGRAIANQFEFVVDDLGISPDDLVGVDPFLDGILAANADIEYMIVRDVTSKVLFARGLSPEVLERVLPGLPEPTTRQAPGPRSPASPTVYFPSSWTIASPPCCTWASAGATCATSCPTSCMKSSPSSWSPCS